jgi:predicted methyltransferase
MRYLLDKRGLGKSYKDVLSLFYDLRNGKSFPDSFQDNFGISVSDYENEFFDRMRAYLGSTYRY